MTAYTLNAAAAAAAAAAAELGIVRAVFYRLDAFPVTKARASKLIC